MRRHRAAGPTPGWRGRWRGRWLAAVFGAVLSLVAGACGSSSSSGASASMAVVARVGSLEIIHPFLPAPPSPSVASVYLIVRNTGSSPDRLVSISTPMASRSLLMSENPSGSMTPLINLAIPAHGEASLSPGHYHLMLENPSTTFTVGQAVVVTLHFADAGAVTVEVPVVPLSAITNDDGMAGMKGM